MFVLTCDIQVGNKRFTAVNEVTVEHSVYKLGATATIKLPVTSVLRQADLPATRVETAQAVAVGDSVEIRLGYNGRLRTEFRGYVKALNLRTPLEIVCEDEFWACRRRNVTSGGTVTLADLLAKCGLTVGFAETLTLKNYAIPDKPVSSVLANLAKNYGLSVFFDLDGRVYACRPEKVVGDAVKYELRYNVISDDDLQYLNRKDLKIQVRAISFRSDGTQVEARKGVEGGTSKTLYFYDVDSMAELAALVQNELERETADGYDGSITTFLEPYAAPAMVARLTDPVYPERSGDYYIESVRTTFGRSGARRTVEIGSKVQ